MQGERRDVLAFVDMDVFICPCYLSVCIASGLLFLPNIRSRKYCAIRAEYGICSFLSCLCRYIQYTNAVRCCRRGYFSHFYTLLHIASHRNASHCIALRCISLPCPAYASPRLALAFYLFLVFVLVLRRIVHAEMKNRDLI